MILVEKHIIKKSNKEWNKIDGLSFKSKNLYNYALYKQNERFAKEGKIYSYNQLEKLLRVEEKHETYFALPNNTSQQILMLLFQNYKSFFSSIKSWKKNKTKFKGCPKPPRYKDKIKGRNILVFTINQARLHDDIIKLPRKTELNPIKTKVKSFKQVRIVPKNNFYVIEVVYEKLERKIKNTSSKLAIDIGVNNLLACSSNNNNSIIINGKPLKSINKKFNKDKSKIQSKLEKTNKRRTSKKLKNLTAKHTNRVNDYLHKASRKVVTFCESNKISEIAIGYNKDWKQNINMGKKNNQTFVDIPFYKLVSMIEYKSKLNGIKVHLVTEEYTSKCSSIDKEKIKKHDNFLGKRIKRGLYKTKQGLLINADINGSLNIGRKVFSDAFVPADIGYVVNPIQINIA